jgi:hypothetical protein
VPGGSAGNTAEMDRPETSTATPRNAVVPTVTFGLSPKFSPATNNVVRSAETDAAMIDGFLFVFSAARAVVDARMTNAAKAAVFRAERTIRASFIVQAHLTQRRCPDEVEGLKVVCLRRLEAVGRGRR